MVQDGCQEPQSSLTGHGHYIDHHHEAPERRCRRILKFGGYSQGVVVVEISGPHQYSMSSGPPPTAEIPVPSQPGGIGGQDRVEAPNGPRAFQASREEWKQPCTLKGMQSAFFAGTLGYMFGLVPSLIRNRLSAFGICHADGMASARTFAVMSGLYTTVSCICERVRMKDDGFNRGFAGCSTGLVLGWGGGPASAAQSCLGIGLISYLLDMGGSTPPAQAAEIKQQSKYVTLISNSKRRSSSSSTHSSRNIGCHLSDVCRGLSPAPYCQVDALSHPVMWLGAVSQPAYFR